ncbi:ATP-binding protein [Thermoactinospora rubra]|uniref:ATP-binding protein n=1 Tax=Thermoactinospora rubra TaxID=1088767 RepID=UPI0030B80F08
MRTHELADLEAGLADRFRLLSRGSRTAQPRHQTLRAVVDWSWALLSEEERLMAARLTVFAGSADARAAERVCGVPAEVLDSLADKSLVEVHRGRYRMLETVRAFCAEQLAGPDEVRQAHAAFFLDLALRGDRGLRGPDQLAWLETLSAEHDNLMAALGWAAGTGRTRLGYELVAALAFYLWIRGLRGSAVPHAAALLARTRPGEETSDGYVLAALLVAGHPEWARHRAAVSAAAAASDHPFVTFLWPMTTGGRPDVSGALAMLERALAGSDPWRRAMADLIFGYPPLASGRHAEAERRFTTAVELFRSLGERWGTALAIDSLAALKAVGGDTAGAAALLDEALPLAERLGAVEDLADMLCSRGDHRLDGGDPAAALADYERAGELARKAGLPSYAACALRGRADVARMTGDLASARRLYEEALAGLEPGWMRTIGNLARALVGLGLLDQAAGDRPGARARFVEAMETAVAAGALTEAARPVEALAGLEEPEAAAALLGAASVLRGRPVDGTAARAHPAAYRRGARLTPRQALRLAGLTDEVIDASPTVSLR